MSKTIVAFNAHPDDEALLTGGTLARLAAEGHRVVLVTATDGVMGPAESGRLDELRAAAAILGAARVVHLGYADSGHGPLLYPDPPDRVRFARADPAQAAARLADILREERADLLLSYDANGGYGHRDHVKVHEVGAIAAGLTGVRVLEATVPRGVVVALNATLRLLGLRQIDGPADDGTAEVFTRRAHITHRVRTGRYASLKRDAVLAHLSQVGKARMPTLFRGLARLPTPLLRLLLAREWLAEPRCRHPPAPPAGRC